MCVYEGTKSISSTRPQLAPPRSPRSDFGPASSKCNNILWTHRLAQDEVLFGITVRQLGNAVNNCWKSNRISNVFQYAKMRSTKNRRHNLAQHQSQRGDHRVDIDQAVHHGAGTAQ